MLLLGKDRVALAASSRVAVRLLVRDETELALETGLSKARVKACLDFLKKQLSLQDELVEDFRRFELIESKRERRPPEALEAKLARQDIFALLEEEVGQVKDSEKAKEVFMAYARSKGEQSMRAIGKRFKISHERVRQLFERVKEKLLKRPRIKKLLEGLE